MTSGVPASQPETVLRTVGLSLAYGARVILRDVNLEVRAGEFWFFLGQNGEGKTTLLRGLLGLIRPRSGQVWRHPILGRRECIGFVPQRCDLNPTLPTTVREFVLSGLVGIRGSTQEQNARLVWALEQIGLAGMAEEDYWSLSGGQRQRALVARALVRQPTLLFLDEPTSNLDIVTEGALLQALAGLHRAGHHTLLYVTHNLPIATRHATHIAFLHSGTVMAGPRAAMLTRDNIAQVYGFTGQVTGAGPCSALTLPVSYGERI